MISVIIPVYNVEKYIEKCIESVTSQSFDEVEIIAVDDGSVDKSGEILEKLAQKDARIKVIHRKNGGLSAARNSGLDAAHGDRIAFVDSDDYIDREMLARLSDIMDKTGCEIAQCRYLRTDGKSDVPAALCDYALNVYGREDAMSELVKNRRFEQVVWNKLYSASCVSGLRFPEGKCHEDEFFTWRAFLRAEKIADADFVGYYYLSRGDSIMGIGFSEKRLDALTAIAERTEYLSDNMPAVYPESCRALIENCMYQYQCFLKDEKSDPACKCRLKIKKYLKTPEAVAALKASSGKDKLWLEMFIHAPEKTAALRNRMKIGF